MRLQIERAGNVTSGEVESSGITVLGGPQHQGADGAADDGLRSRTVVPHGGCSRTVPRSSARGRERTTREHTRR